MKSCAPWVCLLAASVSYKIYADDFSAYRLGDYSQSVDTLMKKSSQDPVADYYLGRLYLYGYGQLKNTNVAVRYFTKSAEKGYLPAVVFMAKYSLMHDKNEEEAVRWFKQAASLGDVNAQLFMAAAYLYGVGVKQNVDAASRYYIDAAKNGNPIAQYALAENFIDSRHAANTKLGLIWLNKAANNANPKALTKLGNLYINGKLVSKDVEKGVSLLQQAAAQNDVNALLSLGQVALTDHEVDKAIEWYKKAASMNSAQAYFQLSRIYLDEKSPSYDPKMGFDYTLRAAQDGVVDAKKQLVILYQQGKGTKVNPDLARQWELFARQPQKNKTAPTGLAEAALWLSNGKSDKIADTAYQMDGILNAWNNPMALRNNNYNPAPEMEKVSSQEVFKPQFVFIEPNDIPINNYYDALMSKTAGVPANQWTYPQYPLNPQITALEKVHSMVLAKFELPVPYRDANDTSTVGSNELSLTDLLWEQDWRKQTNYSSVFSQMYFRAILGDSQSQFEIGQMFQYGIGVAPNEQAAIVFYQNAAEQQHLGAQYNLGILYLQKAKDAHDYQTALNWLTDAAFKGNSKAQYVLARLLEEGRTGTDGTVYIARNHEQALSMLYLSAANNYGLAEYQLADYLAHEESNQLSTSVKQQKIALIQHLYAGAAKSGVAQALLPLAFYNAMDADKTKQAQAFTVADEQANLGNDDAALLLGLLYDRGVGTSVDKAKALYWYQQAGTNPVSQFILGTYNLEGRGLAVNKEKGAMLLQSASDHEFSYADFNLAVFQHDMGKPFLPDLIRAYDLNNSQAGILLADYYLAENATHHDAEQMHKAQQIYAGLAKKGDQYAQLKLGYIYDKGLGVKVDPLEAQKWYLASAEQGNSLGQYLLGQLYQTGQLGQPDYAVAREWYQKAASKLSMALVALGFMDETVDDNYTAAFKFYEQAANQGNQCALYDLGLMYEYAKGLPLDYQKAKDLFLESATKGSAQAMNQLADMYFYGLGQAKDETQALLWYKRAADLGSTNALYALGLMSETGVATKLDFNDALRYYQAAADKGHEKAMLALARMYHYGLGVKPDYKLSAALYQKLADRQNAYAQYQLGTYYLEGIAGQRIPDKGKQLLEQARDNGSQQAKQALQRLEAQTPSGKISFVQPVEINAIVHSVELAADRRYLEALNEWNQGHEIKSRMLLQRLVTQYPHFIPAKRAYEQINQV